MAQASLFQKDLPQEKRVFYYESEEADPIQTKEQENREEVGLPEGFEFVPRGVLARAWSWLVYSVFYVFGQWYERCYWRLKIHGREKIKAAKGQGYLIYANHTNPFHDLFGPGVVADRRIYTIISPVNLKLPGVGWVLPALGGLPLGKSQEEKQKFNEAVDVRLGQKRVVTVYPEAHVWPYYTGVRKFPSGSRSFKYAARNGLPVFAMTTTYHRRKGKSKVPRMEAYVDGPFYPKAELSLEENCDLLAEQVYNSMVKNAKHNTYEYFQYVKKSAKDTGQKPDRSANLDKSTKTKKGKK